MQFTGRWIGETQGCDSPAHIWQISQVGTILQIDNLWEGGTKVGRMTATLLQNEPAFHLWGRFKAVLVDPQHFIIPGWDTNDARGNTGPDYDVVFSRPGIPELMARKVWETWKESQKT